MEGASPSVLCSQARKTQGIPAFCNISYFDIFRASPLLCSSMYTFKFPLFPKCIDESPYPKEKSPQPSRNACRANSSHLIAEVRTWPLQPRVSYMSLGWHRGTKPFLKGSGNTVMMIQGSYKCLRSDCQPKRRKQRHTWVGWWDVDKANGRYPEGRLWMQGVGSEDSELRPPHTNTDIYRDPLILTWTYSAQHMNIIPDLMKKAFLSFSNSNSLRMIENAEVLQ